MYYLVINGDPEDAEAAAIKFNVDLSGATYDATYNQTIAEAKEYDLTHLKEWFIQSTFRDKGALLYYGRR